MTGANDHANQIWIDPRMNTAFSDQINSDNSGAVLMRLRKMIDAEEFETDGRLPTERELSERLSVGRRAVRRALEVLEAEGLIWRRQGKGTFIGQAPNASGVLAARISGQASVLEVMTARLCVEPVLARLCAEKATPAEIRRMRELADRTETTEDTDAAELWDGALHRFIARTAGNPILLTTFSLIDELRTTDEWRDLRQKARGPDTLRQYHHQHTQIIDFIESGDGEGAQIAMELHLKTLLRRVERILAQDGRKVA